MEMEKRKMMKIQKQKEADQQRLLDELNKRQLYIIGKKSKYALSYKIFFSTQRLYLYVNDY